MNQLIRVMNEYQASFADTTHTMLADNFILLSAATIVMATAYSATTGG
jgi:hypothetical protein